MRGFTIENYSKSIMNIPKLNIAGLLMIFTITIWLFAMH